MSRRVTLPAADEIFRRTVVPDEIPPAATVTASAPTVTAPEEPVAEPSQHPGEAAQSSRRPSGRVRHDEKMTVYLTADELLELEHARLKLRRDHGLAVDRGRLVRAALAIALAELDANDDDSLLLAHLGRP